MAVNNRTYFSAYFFDTAASMQAPCRALIPRCRASTTGMTYCNPVEMAPF
jgi:hypothetical protein